MKMAMDLLPQLQTVIPGPRSRELAAILKRYEAPTVTCVTPHRPIFWERAEGVNVWDVDGNRFLDLTSAFGVASLGHSCPAVVEAIRKQCSLLCHAMGDVHPAELKASLCARLSTITFERWTGGRSTAQALLCNSGFEAVEAALKTARLFTRKRGVIAFEGAYHGLGYGALEATWRQDFRLPFLDQLGHFVEFVRYPREGRVNGAGGPPSDKARSCEQRGLEEIEREIHGVLQQKEIGAILVEPFQGRGGEVIPPKDFLPMLRRICDQRHILLIADEIYTGFWRTGRWFGVEHSGVIPDLICVGKALTGSLPLSACIGRRDVMSAWPESLGESLHTSTFLGNPLACAAALASIHEFESHAESWNVAGKGKKFLEELSFRIGQHTDVKEIRGMGLMIGMEFKPNAPIQPSTLCEHLLERGLVVLPSGSQDEVLALTPPLIMKEKTLVWCAQELARTLLVSGSATKWG